MTPTEKMIALMRRLRIEMNGAVTEAMEARTGLRGGGYGLNYGVSATTIREVVEQEGYAGDHELAQLLWKQDVRELKLSALWVEDPAQLTPEQMEAWASDWNTPELVEQSAMQLFWRAPHALEVAQKWLLTSEPQRRSAAGYMLGKLAGTVPAEALQLFDFHTAEQSAVYALREIYRHRPDLQSAVCEALDRLPALVAEELRWQIDYLPQSES